MSQRDVLAELRTARVEAPAELRNRVRVVARTAEPPARRFRARRVLLVLTPVAIAAATAAIVVAIRPSSSPPARRAVFGAVPRAVPNALETQVHGSAAGVPALAPSPARVQRYGASLTLRVVGSHVLSDDVKSALRIVGSYEGHVVSVHVTTTAGAGSAALVVKVPRTHVQQAIARLSRLGTIVSEQVDVQDAQAGINATDRTIRRLQAELATLRKEPQSPSVEQRIAALTTQIVSLQRSLATTVRTDHFATVRLSLTTAQPAAVRRRHGPLHGLGVAFRWAGIGLAYALALGAPAIAVVLLVWLTWRAIRRRRVDALLSRP